MKEDTQIPDNPQAEEPAQPAEQRGYPWLIIAAAVAIVALLSMVPWSDLTDQLIKDYDLLADIKPTTSPATVGGNEIIDPELLEAMAQSEAADSVSQDGSLANIGDIEGEIAELAQTLPSSPGRINGEMVIEDYTADHQGLKRLKQALASGSARIAVLGDSYIEGDIFTQDIRSQLQRQYGGRGVGYVAPYSPIAGFRRTVNINGTGWTQHGIGKGNNANFTIAGEYYTADDGSASVKYKGYKRDDRLAAWNRSQILYRATQPGKITMIADADTLEIDVVPSDAPQQAFLMGETSQLTIRTSVPGLAVLGVWLTDASGVTVDCMSVRGDSGITHRNVNSDLAAQMRPYVDYDLIVLEYGINALSSKQEDYSAYGKLMVQVVEKIKECYPQADILMLGVGDRGEKVNGEVHSLPPIDNMVKSQRIAAQKAECLFWDTREAMGGADAIVDWRERRLANGDYIHLNSDGGRELATLLLQSLNRMLDDTP